MISDHNSNPQEYKHGKYLGKRERWCNFFPLFLVSFKNIRLYKTRITLFAVFIMYIDVVYMTIVGQRRVEQMELYYSQVPIFCQN